MLIRTRDVFGIPGENLLLAFYANRDIGRFNVKHRNAAHKMFKAMGYAEDEPKWYREYGERNPMASLPYRPPERTK